jgi:hypothetical protein
VTEVRGARARSLSRFLTEGRLTAGQRRFGGVTFRASALAGGFASVDMVEILLITAVTRNRGGGRIHRGPSTGHLVLLS